MIRLRLLVLLAGAAALVATPALAGAVGQAGAPGSQPTRAGGEEQARDLLARAAHAATSRSWSGTQYVGTWRGGAQTFSVLEVTHRAGAGSTVTTTDGSSRPVVTPDLDERLLTLLADHYELVVAGSGRCTGRAAHLVEARREGVDGPGRVAGRFWLDRTSGLVLRREVFDESGARLRSSAFVDLVVAPAQGEPRVVGAVLPRRRDPAAALVVRRWQPPPTLPNGLQLFDAEVRRHGRGTVLHLAYSDGLTTLSVFAQRGALTHRPGPDFRAERVRGTRAWVQPAAPERVVWQGDGQVFTLVSDAGPATVRAAVGALPRDPVPRSGLLARFGRGVGRVGSWLNPLD